MNLKNIITIILISIFIAISYYFNWILWIISFVVSIWFYLIIFYWFHILWKKLRKKQIKDFYIYSSKFLFNISVFIFFTISIIWTWVYLSNEVYKAEMPEYTISNWEKTVKFQTMVHIWSPEFYSNIKKNIKNFKKEWWVYFYEWVRPWNKENTQAFNEAIWINFDKDLYKNVSKLYWVTNQNNIDFLWLVNDLDFNVDLDINTIIEIYNKNNNWDIKEKKEPIDANKQIIETLAWLNQKELNILIYINQAILNNIIWNKYIQNTLQSSIWGQDIFDVIIDERDKNLADKVNESEYQNIYITYWLLHFDWFLKELKKYDDNWKIINTNYLYPID